MLNIQGAFHIHSNHSYDGKVPITEIKKIYQKAGYSFVIMTEHGETFNNKKWLKYSNLLRKKSKSNFIFVPGIEINVGKGLHIILLGNLSNIELKHINQIRAAAESSEVIAIGAHIHTIGSKNDLSWLNGVEIFNSRYNKYGVPPAKSTKLFKTWRKKNKELWTIFGTDFHEEHNFSPQSIEMVVSEISEGTVLNNFAKGTFYNKMTVSLINNIKFEFRQKARLPLPFNLLYFFVRAYHGYKPILTKKIWSKK